MLTRGLFDSLSLWPAVFWPIVFSSCFWGYVRLCQTMATALGVSPIGGPRLQDKLVTYLAAPLAAAFEVGVHAYMLYVVGYLYIVVAIPVYVFGWVLIPYVLDSFRPGLTVLAATHALFVAAFLVLLGLFDIGFLRAMNGDIYGLLMGVPAAL